MQIFRKRNLHSSAWDRKVLLVSRPNYLKEPINLQPGRYRVFGFPPMTGLALNKWIEVSSDNTEGCYGPANIPVHEAMPNITRVEDEHGSIVWPRRA